MNFFASHTFNTGTPIVKVMLTKIMSYGSYPYLVVSLLGYVSPRDWFISLTSTSRVPRSWEREGGRERGRREEGGGRGEGRRRRERDRGREGGRKEGGERETEGVNTHSTCTLT